MLVRRWMRSWRKFPRMGFPSCQRIPEIQIISTERQLVFSTVRTHLRYSVFDDFLVLHITLVADQKFVDTLSSIAINFLQPLLDVVERVHVGHIVDNADAVCSSVVRRCDRSESFLASSIPL